MSSGPYADDLHGPGSEWRVRISFVDNGPGIAAEMLDRLFEPFVTSKRRGLGLGLSVCQSIIRAHRGRIWASNNEDRGATFWIALPATSAPRGLMGLRSNIGLPNPLLL
jgi:signal transduction histidine kinase